MGGQHLFTGFIRDLTATQKIEQELRQAQKMEAVGQLTGGIAHDFNNLLTVILGNLEMLEMQLTDERQLELVREACATAEHGAQLTERLLAFGRRQPLQPKLIDVGDLLGDMTPLLRRTLGETIRVRSRSDNDLWPVLVDPSQLQNAILNLAINARDAMPGGGRLTITAENTELEADYARLHPEVRVGRYVVIAVTDTGTGMSEEVQERAFEPFFTTKEVGTGSGLGLSMVYGFVKQSGGHVTIYSEPRHGTTIRMYLPRAEVPEESSEARAPEPPMDALRGQGETVLLVEDEPRVRRMTTGAAAGPRLPGARGGQRPGGAGAARQHPEVDLLFTDMVMPGGMTGADLAGGVLADRARDEGAVHLGLCRAGCGAAGAGDRGALAQEAVQHTEFGAGPAGGSQHDQALRPGGAMIRPAGAGRACESTEAITKCHKRAHDFTVVRIGRNRGRLLWSR